MLHQRKIFSHYCWWLRARCADRSAQIDQECSTALRQRRRRSNSGLFPQLLKLLVQSEQSLGRVTTIVEECNLALLVE